MSILAGKSLEDLRAIALQMGISGAEKMRRTMIIRALTSGDEAQGSANDVGKAPEEPGVPDVSSGEVSAESTPAPKRRGRKKKSETLEPETAAAKEPDAPEKTADSPSPAASDTGTKGKKRGSGKSQSKKNTKERDQKQDADNAGKNDAPSAETAPAAPETDTNEVKPSEPKAAASADQTPAQTDNRKAGKRPYTRRKNASRPTDSAAAEQTEPAAAETATPAPQDASQQTVSQDAPETQAAAPEAPAFVPIPDDDINGVLEVMPDGYGFLRTRNYLPGSEDIYVSPSQIKRFGLRPGDRVEGTARKPGRGEKFRALSSIFKLNGDDFITLGRRPRFETLTPIYPDSKLRLETEDEGNRARGVTARILDIMAPIGRGQRGLIVSPPKAGKTELLKKIAHGITANHPDVDLIVLLIDERPEEVTDMQRSIKGEIVYSTFDEEPDHHVKAAEMVQEHAKRMVEQGKDVVILMDSLTRLTRAYNLTITTSGRTMSGGMDTAALIKPKKFLGAARNIEFGGSLTIIATALIDTGSKMDDLIYEEFKGTGNLEIHLDRKLSERRIFPAIDIYKSGTRRDDLLLSAAEKDAADKLRRAMSTAGVAECTEMVINQMMKTPNNEAFMASMSIRV